MFFFTFVCSDSKAACIVLLLLHPDIVLCMWIDILAIGIFYAACELIVLFDVAYHLFPPLYFAQHQQKLFWLIAVGANAPWAIFPTLLLISSFIEVMRAFNNKKKDD